MKRSFVVSVIFACILSVVGGHFYYNNKLEQTASAAKLEFQEKDASVKEEQKKKSEEETAADSHFQNAPEGLSELYQQKKAAGESLIITLVGSTTTTEEEGTWAAVFKEKMAESYGEDVEIHIVSFGDRTSWQVPDQPGYADLKEMKTDVVIIEPFLLNDNGGVISIEDTLIIVNRMIGDIKKTNPEAMVMIQPSNPISKPKYYAEQISGLKAFAEEKEIPYLDYWESWPSVDSEEIKDYYDENTLLANEEGHKLWADYIYNVFK